MARSTAVLTGAAILAALVAGGLPCAGGDRALSAPAPSGIQPGYPTDRDAFAPLVITPIAPDPVPVRGTDGRLHVVYELQVFNASPRPATLLKVQTLAGGFRGRVVATLSRSQIVSRTRQLADYPLTPVPATTIPAGRVALLLLDDVYATRRAVPARMTHRVTARFGAAIPDQGPAAKLFPARVTQIGGAVTTSRRRPVVIGPPLAGGGWVAVNACCTLTSHRGAMVPIGGRINGAERYAVDWSRFDLSGPLFDLTTGLAATFRGDPTRNESYLSFGQPILAVADGRVVRVVSDMPEAPPQQILKGLRLDQLGGNHVTVDIGSGVYAFYAHLKAGSPTVRVGDRVRRGQVIALLGNSGQSSEAHLHFQLMRGIAPLSSDNVPFEIDRFSLVGTAAPAGVVPRPTPGPRSNELPLHNSVTEYPAAPVPGPSA